MMVNLKRNLLSVTLISAIMATAMSAQAHDSNVQTDQTSADAEATAKKVDEEKTVDTVVVSGIRAGVENTIEVKRESNSIVEVISADDLGKLPNISIVD